MLPVTWPAGNRVGRDDLLAAGRLQNDVIKRVCSGVGGGKGVTGRQARGEAVGADEVDGALILIRAAAGEVVVGVERGDRHSAHGACHVIGLEVVVTSRF